MTPARRSRGAVPGPDLFSSMERRERASGEAPAPEPAAKPEARIWSVGALTHAIAAALKGLGRIAVEGEISQIKRAASGHVYFALKDEGGVVSCAIWRSRVEKALRGVELREGDKVVVHGALDVYAPRGTYSLLVEKVEARGIGALLADLEKLKAKLRADGWFERSLPLPQMPRMVGIVTSRDTAAFQDFLRTRTKRWPLYPVRIAHAPVQGRGAAERIADAIRRLDASGVDVICVCRGGGSLEDLWAFNELPVAQAIHEASVPVVCGVGHETDVTLADFVADHRAHTPTDAATLVLPDRREIEDQLERAAGYLAGAIGSKLERREERLARLARARVLRDAEWITGDRSKSLERAQQRLERALAQRLESAQARVGKLAAKLRGVRPAARIERDEARLSRLKIRLSSAADKRLVALSQRLKLADRSLRSISPFAVLERGYSITLDESGRAVRSAKDASLVPGAKLRTKIGQGEIDSVVEAVRTDEDA